MVFYPPFSTNVLCPVGGGWGRCGAVPVGKALASSGSFCLTNVVAVVSSSTR